MELDRIRAMRNNVPFRPFFLTLDDGREFLIEQPYYIGFSPKGDLVMVVTREQTMWFAPERVEKSSFVRMKAS